ncbi:MAG: HTH domain-containing protein, partial [Phycisphaerales bacterium]|nr:HTH domain-containing protein [Phycisphaerales bacterium]
GENLLADIRRQPATADTPVIVMTAHGTDGPDLGVKQMKLGATDFVNKPFDGGKLDTAIREAVAKRQIPNGRSIPSLVEPKPAGPPRPFSGGLLILHEQRAELCGIPIVENGSRGHAWRILEILAEKNGAGKYRSLSGQQLATKLGRRVGQNAVSQCIRALRKRIATTLIEQLNIECGDQNVIQSGGRGYRLNERIEVRFNAGDRPATDPGGSDEFGAADGAMGGSSLEFNERQQWILDELRAGAELRRRDIETRFNCSTKSAKRDLADLREQGLIAFEAKPVPGYYRLCSGSV